MNLIEEYWPWLFWGFLAALCALEVTLGKPDPARRRRVRWPANLGLSLINGAIISLVPLGAVIAALWAERHGVGALNAVAVPFVLVAVLTVLFRSLMQYGFHWLMHRVPMLWRIHRVHHCDDYFDGSTGLRFHPLEMIATLVLFVPLAVLLGLDPRVLAVFEAVEILYGIATHTALRLPQRLDRAARPLLITPALHRVHHATDPRLFDRNFGTVFTLWDRLFGTYFGDVGPGHRPPEVGVQGVGPDEAGRLGWLLAAPFAAEGEPRADDAAEEAAPPH